MSGAVVYFIKTATEPPFLKVGKSRNFKSRFRQLQGSWPMTLEVMGKIECASEEDAFRNEKECFARLKRFRLRGEWFKLDDASLESEFRNSPEFQAELRSIAELNARNLYSGA